MRGNGKNIVQKITIQWLNELAKGSYTLRNEAAQTKCVCLCVSGISDRQQREGRGWLHSILETGSHMPAKIIRRADNNGQKRPLELWNVLLDPEGAVNWSTTNRGLSFHFPQTLFGPLDTEFILLSPLVATAVVSSAAAFVSVCFLFRALYEWRPYATQNKIKSQTQALAVSLLLGFFFFFFHCGSQHSSVNLEEVHEKLFEHFCTPTIVLFIWCI